MKERKVLLTYEAIYDIADAKEYISFKFGESKAEEYYKSIYDEIYALSTDAMFYSSSGFNYRKYIIFKKPFPPAIIFWVVTDNEVHILRVPREEYNWQEYFETHKNYNYSYPDN